MHLNRHLLLGTVAATALLLPAAAIAQAASPTPTPAAPPTNDQTSGAAAAPAGQGSPTDAQVRDIVVTGSRLSNPNFTSPTPVTTLNTEAIQQRAPAQISDVINELPAFRTSRTANGNGRVADQQSGVQSLVDLRGLGDIRTLVLVNGRRHVGTVASGSFDTNMIPVGLIDRVEVVTGGASAAYGSDAVAGVTNFILKNHMTGVSVSAQSGITDRGDGAQYVVNLAGGTPFAGGRGHIIFGADYSKTEGIGNIYERDSSEPGLLAVSAAQRASLGLPAQAFASGVELANVTPGGLILTRTSAGQLYGFDAGGNASVFNQGTVFGSGTTAVMTGSTANQGYNPNAFFPLQNSNSRIVAYGRAEFELTDHITVYGEGNYAHTDLPPSLTANYSAIFQVQRSSLPASVQALYPATATNVQVGRLFTENGGGNITYQNLDMHSFVGGVKGDWGKWKGEVYYQHGWTHQDFNTSGLVLGALYKAIYGCNGTATNPNLSALQISQVALYEATTGKSCVAFNPFGVNTNQAALNYIYNTQHQDTVISQDVVSGSISGSPFALWAGDVSLAVGGEWRQDKLSVTSDVLGNASIYSLGNFTTYGGKNTVKEGFAEIGVPLLKDMSFTKSLDLNGAVRRTDYALSGAVTTWKVGGVWEPIAGLRLRATRSRDIRAPNLNDLYFIGGALPTSTTNNIPGTYGYGTTGTTNIFASGNTSLVPEKADTFTGGGSVQFSGGALRGLRLAVDYYDIKINGAIARPNSAQTQAICASLIASGATSCPGIVLTNTGNGIASAGNLSVNLNELKAEGIDFDLGYRLPSFGLPGRFELHALANYAIHLQQYLSLIRAAPFETAGSAQGVPRWTYNMTLGYEQGQSGIEVQLRGFSGVKYDVLTAYTLAGGATNGAQVVDPTDAGYVAANNNSISQNRFPAALYTNLSWHVGVTKRFQLFGVVNNVFDKQPPAYALIAITNGSRNLNYDLIGRSYKLGARVNF